MDEEVPVFQIDKTWFVNQLERAGKSMRGLAKHLNQEPSTISRMFAGKRQMKLQEAEDIARFIGITVDDVLSHSGISLERNRIRKVSFAATIDSAGNVTDLPEPLEIPAEMMARVQANIPIKSRDDIFVAQVRSPDGALNMLDDSVAIYPRPSGINPAPASTFSISRLTDGTTVLGHVKSWRKTGEAVIKTPDGKEQNVKLEASAGVLVFLP